MKTKAGYKSLALSFNRLAVIASASVTKEKNAIHSLTEVDITEPRRLIKDISRGPGETVIHGVCCCMFGAGAQRSPATELFYQRKETDRSG